MKHLLKLKILFIIICIFCVSEIAHSKPWPPEIDVTTIRFNYESGHTNDGLKIRKNASTNYPNSTWSSSKNEPLAYIKSQSSRYIQVCFYVEDEDYDYMAVHTTTSGSGVGDVNASMSVPPWWEGQYWWRTLMLGGEDSVPGSVGKRNFTWSWYLDEIGLIELDEPLLFASTGAHTYYTLLAAPQSPMSDPWTEVLDYACDWASGKTSSSSAITEVVKGIYGDFGFVYDTYDGSPRYTGDKSQSFNLTSLLSDVPGSNIVVNCYDCGKAVKIFANAIGCGASYKYSSPFGYVNCIKPIGRGWANNPFYSNPAYSSSPIVGEDLGSPTRSGFGNHAFGTIGSTIYDTCLKVDTDGNPDAAPHTESWATGWSWSTYKLKVVDDNPSTSTGSATEYTFSVY